MATNKGGAATLDFESLNNDELLKKEQEFKEMMTKIAEAKAKREEQMRNQAFDEINTVLAKYVGAENVIKPQALLQFLVEKQFVQTMSSGVRGRPAVNKSEEEILFSMPYKNEGGQREMTLRLAKDSKMPSPMSGAATQLKAIKDKSFADIKGFFNSKFEEFKNTDAGKQWVKTFFPNQFVDIYSQA